MKLGLFNAAEKEMDSSALEPVPFEEPINIYQETYEFRRCKTENRQTIFNPYTPEPVLH
ncbi:MAG: hypothetical protein RIN55_00880 [Tissierellaceae bacterium]|nr:hypothetical protein [Tissierellaceae bacterium]